MARDSQLLLVRIRAFISATGMKPGEFGAKAAKDAKLIATLEKGRELREPTREKIENWMVSYYQRVRDSIGAGGAP